MIRELAPPVPNVPLQFDNLKQEQIHRRLRLIGEGPAAFFRDAYRLMSKPRDLETTTHLVGHCLREIESAVKCVLLSNIPEPPEQKPKKGGSGADGHRNKVARIVKAYGIDPNGMAARLWYQFSDSTSELHLHRRAHRDALMVPRDVDENAIQLWREMQCLLDEVLDRFEARFIEHVQLLEKLAALEHPTDSDLERLRNNVPNNAIGLSHFFSTAHVAWLPLLRKGGYFDAPTAMEVGPDGAWFRFPSWPAAQYLARIAALELDEAATVELGGILLSIPDTDNVAVLDDLVLASMAIPLDDAVVLAHKATAQLRRNAGPQLPERLAALALRLLRSGRISEGLVILAELIRCEPTDTAFGDPMPRCDQYEFDVILRDVVPEAVQIGQLQAFEMLCHALKQATWPVGLDTNDEWLDDVGCGQRSAIEPNVQDRFRSYGVLAAVIDAVRDAGEALVATGKAQLSDLIGILERQRADVFRRIAMHLLRVYPDNAPQLVAKYLLDERFLDSVEVWHERRLLERDCFGMLDAMQQATFLQGIMRGPAPDTINHEDSELQAVEPSLLVDESNAEQWRLHHMDMIAEQLPENLKAYHGRLVTKYGKPRHPDFLTYVDAGPTKIQFGPLSDEEINSYSVADLLAFLQGWSPRDDRAMMYSRGELATQIASRVSREPDVFAESAKRFIGLHPAYVSALFDGWRKANAEGRAFAWDEPLTLGLWAASAGDDGVSAIGVDVPSTAREWDWVRTELARLISGALEDRPHCFGAEHADRALGIIDSLLAIPDTTACHSGALDRAINSLRGCAMTALISWACWTCRRERREGRDGNLAAMPRARELLHVHVDPAIDASMSTRAVLGYHLPNLVAIDRNWVEGQLEKLVPFGRDADHLLHETWRSYLWHCRPDPGMLRILEPQFALAIELKPAQEPRSKRYIEELIQHLAPAYWSGYLEVDVGPLARFTATADIAARQEFLKHIGFCIFHTEGPVESAILDRAMRYWESRVAAMRASKTAETELIPFGWWFASGKFDETWALEQLELVVATCRTIDLDHSVGERLALLAASNPARVIQCLLILTGNESRGGRALLCRTGIRGAVDAARRANDQQAETLADELVSRLVARGFGEFREFARPQ